MASVNLVVVAGNLTRDPEMRYTPSGTAVAPLSMAINNKYKDRQTGEMKEDVTYVDVDFFGRQAEIAGQYLSKGRGVLVEGRLRLDRWEDRETGKPRSKLKVIGQRMQFLGGPPRSGATGSDGPRAAQGSQGAGGTGLIPVAAGAGASGDVEDGNIPF